MSCSTGMPDWSNTTLENFNQTLLENPLLCTTCTCPLELDGHFFGNMSYYPSLAGNALFAGIFGVLFLVQLILGIRYKTWGFMIGMLGGLFLELLGYVARVLLRDNMFTDSYFIMYLVCLTIGPAFLAAAIYLSLSRMVIIFAPGVARFRPQVYTYIFIGCDVAALILQAAGGAVASTAPKNKPKVLDAGIDTMVAGVAWQVFALALFAVLSAEYIIRVRGASRRNPAALNPSFAGLRAKGTFNPGFIVAIALAALFIFIRSVFRCAELSAGFHGPLANDEVTFMVLEGTMITLACLLLTVFHPGLIVGTEQWDAASWKKSGAKYGDVPMSDTELAGKGSANASDREYYSGSPYHSSG